MTNGALWFENVRTQQLLRIDTTTNRINAAVTLPYEAALELADDGSLWTLGPWDVAPGPEFYTILRVDLQTGALTTVARVRGGTFAVGLGSLWVPWIDQLQRLDIRSGKITKTYPVAVDRVRVACGAVWGTSYGPETTQRIDPTSGRITTYPGTGRVYELVDGCYRWAQSGLRPVDSNAAGIGEVAGPMVQFDGRSFWHSPPDWLQRYDPFAGTDVGPEWQLEPQELDYRTKVGNDATIVAAAGSIWLIRADEVVRYDIPTGA